MWIVAVDGRADGSGAYKITRTNPRVDRGELSWSPDSRRLAFAEGNTIVVGDADGGHRRVVLHTGVAFTQLTTNSPIAWSADGRRIAVIVQNAGTFYARSLRIAIVNVYSRAATTVTVRFPGGALGRNRPPGSYPATDALAWMPDGRHLAIETLAEGEGPDSVTGIWQVAASGGLAHQFVGAPRDVRQGMYPAGEALTMATHAAFSPDGTHLVTDPENRFWLANADGTHGRYLNLGVTGHCTLAQYTWLADSSGLAYVTLCTTPGSISVLSRLYSVPLQGITPRLLYSLKDPDQARIDLAPAYRCVLCGY